MLHALFKRTFVKSFDWLEYSPKLNCAFCFPCRIFMASSGPNVGDIDLPFIQVRFKNETMQHQNLKCTKKQKIFVIMF